MAGQLAKYLGGVGDGSTDVAGLLTVGARLGTAVGLLVPVHATMARKSISNAQTKRVDFLDFIFSPLAT